MMKQEKLDPLYAVIENTNMDMILIVNKTLS